MNWKYITPEVIRSGKFTANNIEEYNEALEYNKLMYEKQPLKYRWNALRDFYVTVNAIAYLIALCLFLKPLVFKGVGGINIAAALIAGGGYAYLLYKYIVPDFGSNDSYINLSPRYARRDQMMRTGGSFGTITSFVIATILTAISVLVIRDSYTVNGVVSFLAFSVCTLLMIFYAFKPGRWSAAVSVIGAASLFLVNPVTVIYAVMTAVSGVAAARHRERMRAEEGYPDFTILVVTTEYQGSRLVRNYDDYNRYDGIDDEMESL